MIEYGDTRVPESFWEKVHVVPETSCWVWTGALKKETARSNKIAIIHPSRTKVTTLLVYMGEMFYGLDRAKQKALRTCGDSTCANPNHVRVLGIGECVIDPEHGSDRYKNGQCKACRKIKDKAIPKEVINERARTYRANLTSRGLQRKNVKVGGLVVKRLQERQKARGLSVFGDVKPDKPWRPEGWSPEPKVKPDGNSNTRAAG